MRLQPKKMVNAETALQRKQQIDQGIALAKKIDALRLELPKEEQALENFRQHSIAAVQKEIDSKILEKDRLDGEIRLKEAQAHAILPSVEEQWKQLEDAKLEFDKSKGDFYQQQGELKQAISLNIQRERENESERKRIVYEHEESQKALEVANECKKDSVKQLLNARAEAENIIAASLEREEAVAVRENEISTREVEINKKLSMIEKWELDLKIRERKLKANQDVLIKSKTYLNKK